MSDSNYLVVNENRITENNRSLAYSALIMLKGLVILVFEVLIGRKLRTAKPVYLVAFRVYYTVTALWLISYLPLVFDRLLRSFPEVFQDARLKTYDQPAFQKVVITNTGNQILLRSSGRKPFSLLYLVQGSVQNIHETIHDFITF